MTFAFNATNTKADTIVFTANGGSDVITGIVSTEDKVNIDALTAATAFTAINGTGHTVVADTVIYLMVLLVQTLQIQWCASATAITTALVGTDVAAGGALGTTVYFIIQDNNNSTSLYKYADATATAVANTELTLLGTFDDQLKLQLISYSHNNSLLSKPFN